MATSGDSPKDTHNDQAASPWVAALNKLQEWDAVWAGQAMKNDDKYLGGRSLAHQVHRIGAGRVECFSHQPKPGRDAPPYPGGHRCRREPPGDLVRSQVRFGHVHSLQQL